MQKKMKALFAASPIFLSKVFGQNLIMNKMLCIFFFKRVVIFEVEFLKKRIEDLEIMHSRNKERKIGIMFWLFNCGASLLTTTPFPRGRIKLFSSAFKFPCYFFLAKSVSSSQLKYPISLWIAVDLLPVFHKSSCHLKAKHDCLSQKSTNRPQQTTDLLL